MSGEAFDPSQLDEQEAELHTTLENGEPEERQSVAALLADSAERDPEMVARHTDLLEVALRDEEETVCADAIDAIAIMVHQDQYPESSIVSALLDALAAVDDLSVRLSTVWVIAAISADTDASMGEIDTQFAQLLRNGEEPIRQQIAADSSLMTIEKPTAFPKILRAYVDGLTDSSPAVRLAATQTLAVIARDDVDAVPEIETVLERMKSIREQQELEAEEIERAIRTVEQANEAITDA